MHFRGVVSQYSVHSILPLEPILSQLNCVNIHDMSFFDIICHYAPNLMSGLVSSVNLTVFCVPFFFLHVCHITC